MKSQFLTTLPFIVILTLTAHAADKPRTIHEYYRETRKRILAESEQDRRTLAQSYMKKLQAARDYYRDKGELISTLTAKKEIERFQTDRSPLDKIPDNVDAKLARFFKTFRQKWNEAKAEEYRKLTKLTEEYVAHLKDLEQSLTRQDELDRALATHRQRQKLEEQIEELKAQLQKISKSLQDATEPGSLADPKDSKAGDKITRIPAELRNEIVAYYTFDHRGIVVKDQSDNGFHGKAQRASWLMSGVSGGAIEFKSRVHIVTFDRGMLAEAFDGASAIAFAAWIRPEKLSDEPPPEAPIVLINYNQPEKPALNLVLSKSETVFGGSASPETGWSGITAEPLTVGSWQHVAGVIDYARKTLSLFIDGKKVMDGDWQASADSFKNYGTQSYEDSVGGSLKDRDRHLEGAVDELLFFRTALTADQVKKVMEATR